MRIQLQVAILFAAGIVFSHASSQQTDYHELNSMFLVGWMDGQLAVVTPSSTFALSNPPGFIGQGSSPLPALAPGGDHVAWALPLPKGPENGEYKSAMGVYSMRDNSWKYYGDFCDAGSATFSPDGTKVAFEAKAKKLDDPNCLSSHGLFMLEILDLATGELTTVPYPGEALMHNARLSWSPDGRYVAGQVGAWASPTKHVVVIEMASGVGRVIAEGIDPSWSPSGDWIAYVDGEMEKCILIHPDGTGAKTVLDISRTPRVLYHGAVWSPDGSKLLLNEAYGPLESKVDVKMLDLVNGKVTTRSRNSVTVFGWARHPAN